MRRVFFVVMLVWAAACAPEPGPTDKSAVIEMVLETPWQIRETRLYPDDVLTLRDASPVIIDGAQKVYRTATEQLDLGAFATAKARILTPPPGPVAVAKECDPGDSEFTVLRIRYVGPDATQEVRAEACEAGRVGALWRDLRQIYRQHAATDS